MNTIKLFFKRLLIMTQFFTTVPINTDLKAGPDDYARGMALSPLPGLLTGLLVAGSHYLLGSVFSGLVLGVLTTVIYILVSGGLHLDGLSDTFDGICSRRSRDRILEIMKDSRVGTFGVIALFSILLLNTSLFSQFLQLKLSYPVLIVFPVLGKLAAAAGAGLYPYARNTESLGRNFIEDCGKKEVIGAALIYTLIYAVLSVFDPRLIIIYPVTLLIPLFILRVLSKSIKGVTGDILGAACELSQTLFLLTCCAVFRLY